MQSIHETRSRWDATLANHVNILDLKISVKDGGTQSPCIIGLRSICWKVFLLFRTLDQSTWPKTISDSRSAYTSLKDHFLKNIENADDLSSEDPLADTETSPWNTLRLDEELRAEIFLDVERCMPDNLYFREPSTQNILLDILFVYCKLNRDIGYRQGMHEVLAPIVWVVSRDAIETDGVDINHEESNRTMISSLDRRFVEHDAFSLFGVVMQIAKTFYEMGSNNDPTTSGLLNNSPIVERSKRIHENYLHHADPELAEHLTAIEILPQIFLIRWIRLLFGREFPFKDVLGLWDILFAEDPGLDLVDLISVAMLLRVRWQLLEADYSAALTLLLRYPVPSAPHGPPTFVADALYLRENLMLDGGDHIISKYSRRAPETTVTRKLPKKIRRARTAEQQAAQRVISPKLTPARIFKDQGGIEGIIQEAAKGVYARGEKWGVGKALRGAMQGLQSGHTSPGNASERARWSLDSGRMISDRPAEMLAKMQVLEQRNRSLAKLLGNAVDELWTQQREVHEKENEAAADALSLAIAKVQFVQVYLENSTMPLPADASASGDETGENTTNRMDNEQREPPKQGLPLIKAQVEVKSQGKVARAIAPDISVNAPPNADVDTLPATPKIGSPKKPSSPQPRPSLEKSPFSWMLGEEQPKSDFVAGSPRQQEKTGGRSGNLFGDAERNSRLNWSRAGESNRPEDEEGDDVFNLRNTIELK